MTAAARSVGPDGLEDSILLPHFHAVQDVFLEWRCPSGTRLDKLAKVKFVIDPKMHDKPRHFAATQDNGLLMMFAPEMVDLPVETLTAIIAHEFGHAADFAYPACWSWPKLGAGAATWVGTEESSRAKAWRSIFGKAAAKSRTDHDDKDPSTNWTSAWAERTRDQVEWSADGIVHAVTGRRIGYTGDCILQTFAGGFDRPRNLR